MRTRLYQAVALAAVLTASATASSPVLSADLPPPPLAPVYEQPLPPENVFEGWYLGGTIGGATVSYDFSPASGSIDSQRRARRRHRRLELAEGPGVVGIEGDFLGADISGSRHFNGGANLASPNIDTMADLRLRAGYAITPRVLLFGTFGGAWANADLPIQGPWRRRRKRRLLRLERRRRRRGRAQPELERALRLSVHRFRLGEGQLSGRLGHLRSGCQHLSRLADLPLLDRADTSPHQCQTGGTAILPRATEPPLFLVRPAAPREESRPKHTRMSRSFPLRQLTEIISGLSQGLAARNSRSISLGRQRELRARCLDHRGTLCDRRAGASRRNIARGSRPEQVPCVRYSWMMRPLLGMMSRMSRSRR